MRVVIVGAGIAGSVMARALSRLPGLDVHCLERVARGDHSESGTGLNVGPNAVKALTAHDPELASSITHASYPWASWRISLTDGTVLFDLPLTQVADGAGWRIRWSELYRVLREAADSVISYGCAITSVGRDARNAGKTQIEWTQAGQRRQLNGIDLLVAGDGRYSQVRRAISGEPATKHIGVSVVRLLVPDTAAGLIDDYEQWFNGPNRLLAFRVPPGQIYLAGTFPIALESPIPDDLKTQAALRVAYTPATRPPGAQARWLIDRLCENIADTHWARMQEHELLFTVPDCNVLYLGDAAHGMVPTLGQGATQALEDAANAARLIVRAWGRGEENVRAWLSAIDALRRERVKFAMTFSLDATETMLEGADPAAILNRTGNRFIENLRTLYRDVPSPDFGA